MNNPAFDDIPSILIVDNEEFNRDVLSELLTAQGYNTATAENGLGALEKLVSQGFDLVLLDIMMPEMNGYEVLEWMKTDEVFCHIPVIMVSAMGDMEGVIKCIKMGAVDYLFKPFDPIFLKARVASSLARKKLHDQEQSYLEQLEEHDKQLQSKNQELLASLEAIKRKEQELEHSAKMIRKKEEQLSLTLKNMDGGIFLMDKDFIIQVVNDQFLELYDFLPEQMQKGVPLVNILRFRAERGDYGPGDPEELAAERLQGYRDNIRNGETTRFEDSVPGNRTVEMIRSFTEGDETVIVANDITERKAAEAALQKSKAELQTALKSEKHAHEELKITKIELAETEAMTAMTTVFEKFVPKQFLSRIAGEGIENIELGKAESTFITILFADIRSFTTFSETVTPQELLNFLNGYFKRMSGSIDENYGFVDKFIGDAIMALFDRPGGTDAENAQGAIQAAIGMQTALKLYNRHRQKQGYSPVETGIGIHSGQTIIGTVGWEDRMDSTVLGDNVNLASRIEGLTKFYGAEILISDSTLRVLADPVVFQQRELDWVRVRGKTEPVGIYEIFDSAPPERQALKRKSGRAILRALAHRKRREWDKTIAVLEKALSLYPEDQALQLHIRRCQELQGMDLPEDWNGAIDLD